MPNPFGYGDTLGFSRTQLANTGLFPTIWAQDAMRLAMPTVYFPMVTPMRMELETRNGQNIVVPVDGEMTDSSWPTLTEGTSITVGSYAMDSFSVVVQEAGRGLAVERLVKQYLVDGMYPGEAQNFVGKLMSNFALSWENQLRGLWLSGKFRIVSAAAGSYSSLQNDLGGTGVGGTGTLGQLALDAVLVEFRKVRTGTLGTFIVNPFPDGLYRCVANWNTLKGLTKEDDFVALETRNQNRAGLGMVYQEIGEWNGFKIIRHDLMPDGTSLCHGRGGAVQAFGGMFEDSDIPDEDIQRIEDPIPFQIRFERNWKSDFHRAKAAAWYVMAGSSKALMDTGTACIRLHTST